MPFAGDFDKLQALQRGLQLAGARAAEECARYTAVESAKLARGQLRRAEAPDGSPWAPLVMRNAQAKRIQVRAERAEARGKELTGRAGVRKPLQGVQKRVSSEAKGGRAELDVAAVGARFSNRGTRHQVARQIVPLEGQPMPDRWRSRILTRCTFIVWRLIRRADAPAAAPGAGP